MARTAAWTVVIAALIGFVFLAAPATDESLVLVATGDDFRVRTRCWIVPWLGFAKTSVARSSRVTDAGSASAGAVTRSVHEDSAQRCLSARENGPRYPIGIAAEWVTLAGVVALALLRRLRPTEGELSG